MGPIYQFHGLSVDCIDLYQPHSPKESKLTMLILHLEQIMNLDLII